MLNQNGGSRTDTLIKLVLVFFISLLSFSVGTFVGKQFSDSQHRMAALEGGEDRSVASVAENHAAEDKQAASEDEINKLSEEFLKKEKAQGAKKKTETAGKEEGSNGLAGKLVGEDKHSEVKKDSAKKTASVKDELSAVSKRIAAGQKSVAASVAASVAVNKAVTAKSERSPSSLPQDVAASSVGKFTVQMFSFPNEDQAAKKASELRDKGVSAFYVPASVKGKTWYRVSAGLFTNRKEALEFATQIQAKKVGVDSTVVQKIAK